MSVPLHVHGLRLTANNKEIWWRWRWWWWWLNSVEMVC